MTYLSLMNNHFGRVGGTNLSPLETSAGRSLSKPVVSLFGSTVIAEIPDSLRAYSPNETRSIEACYIHPGLGTGAVSLLYLTLSPDALPLPLNLPSK